MSMIRRIINNLNSLIHINRYKAELDGKLAELDKRYNDRFAYLEGPAGFERFFCRFTEDPNKLKHLNYLLSSTPTIWGQEDRLEISEKAAVNACLFNTNSGRIKIGDYTFAGSGVSILAGSHDPELSGFLRRDVEFKEGFDIEIGNGVWLASNATILGPCTIEDDAVIAAGAVVVPGTHILKGEMYGGIPAKKIGDQIIIKDLKDYSEKLEELIKREDGILFFAGWSEKKIVVREGKVILGHWAERNEAIIYTDREVLNLTLITEHNDECEVKIIVGEELRERVKVGFDPTTVEVPTGFTKEIIKISFKAENKIFISREVL